MCAVDDTYRCQHCLRLARTPTVEQSAAAAEAAYLARYRLVPARPGNTYRRNTAMKTLGRASGSACIRARYENGRSCCSTRRLGTRSDPNGLARLARTPDDGRTTGVVGTGCRPSNAPIASCTRRRPRRGSGPHRELLARGRHVANLHRIQFAARGERMTVGMTTAISRYPVLDLVDRRRTCGRASCRCRKNRLRAECLSRACISTGRVRAFLPITTRVMEKTADCPRRARMIVVATSAREQLAVLRGGAWRDPARAREKFRVLRTRCHQLWQGRITPAAKAMLDFALQVAYCVT